MFGVLVFSLARDVAASEFFADDKYDLNFKAKDNDGCVTLFFFSICIHIVLYLRRVVGASPFEFDMVSKVGQRQWWVAM